jgi:hypothetical protein
LDDLSQLSPDPLFSLPLCICSFLHLFPHKMAFWRQVGQQLCRVPKNATNDVCLSQSRRYLSSATTKTIRITTQPRSTLPAHRSLQSPWQGYSAVRRSFSATAHAAHGHITPPKPGEEYVHRPRSACVSLTQHADTFIGSTSHSSTRRATRLNFRLPKATTY